MTCQIFLSAKTHQDLDAFSDKIARQILADCARLAHDPILDGNRIKKLQGFKESLHRRRAGDYRVILKRSSPHYS
ncbi:MAG: type II toxin-antitoxin system RelE/ParE family toxin [Nitrospiraceae bacterium]